MTQENEKVIVSSEDTDNVRNYSVHFGVPLTPELSAAMDAFDQDQSFRNMQMFKLELCKWLLSSQHESFKDPLWNHPKSRAEGIVFDLQFEKDVEDVLSTKTNIEKSDTDDHST